MLHSSQDVRQAWMHINRGDGEIKLFVDTVELELATKEQNHGIFRNVDETGEILMSRETSHIQKDEDEHPSFSHIRDLDSNTHIT